MIYRKTEIRKNIKSKERKKAMKEMNNKEMNNREMYNKVFDNVMSIPETHRDVLMMTYGLKGGLGANVAKAMTVDEIVDYWKSYQMDIDPWQIEEIIEEGLEMIDMAEESKKGKENFGFAEIREFRKVFRIHIYNEKVKEGDVQLAANGYKGVIETGGYVEIPDRTPFLDMVYIVKNRTGIENLKAIVLQEEDADLFSRLINKKDLDFVMEHREGLLLGASFGWSDIDDLIEKEQSGRDLRDVIAEEYSFLEFIKFPRIQSLYHHVNKNSQESPESMKAKQKLRRDTACRAAKAFEEMGIKLIFVTDVVDVRPEDVYEYSYLGMDTAMKAVYENPYRIAQTLLDIDTMDEALKPFLQDGKGLF